MVLIGKNKYKYRGMIMSHICSDSLIELHAMATKIGVDTKHFQNKEGKSHYDICQRKKKMALVLGAKEVSDKELILMWREII